jgi:hypothetical protein
MTYRPFTKDEIPYGKRIRWKNYENSDDIFIIAKDDNKEDYFKIFQFGKDGEVNWGTYSLLSSDIFEYFNGINWVPFGKKVGKKYNHMFDVAFTVVSTTKHWDKVPVSELIEGLQKRIDYLKANPFEADEVFGYSDSYEVNNP